MRVYTSTFNGHYPVGASAVIIAESEAQARILLMEALSAEGLLAKNESVKVESMSMLPQCRILNNGDY